MAGKGTHVGLGAGVESRLATESKRLFVEPGHSSVIVSVCSEEPLERRWRPPGLLAKRGSVWKIGGGPLWCRQFSGEDILAVQ
jgi:hypothetical protein